MTSYCFKALINNFECYIAMKWEDEGKPPESDIVSVKATDKQNQYVFTFATGENYITYHQSMGVAETEEEAIAEYLEIPFGGTSEGWIKLTQWGLIPEVDLEKFNIALKAKKTLQDNLDNLRQQEETLKQSYQDTLANLQLNKWSEWNNDYNVPGVWVRF